MSQITGVTQPEVMLRQACWAAGVRGWRVQRRVCGVRTDFAFLGRKIAVFVDGCFWHGCPKCYRSPKTNKAYWSAKVDGNRKRDRRQERVLRKNGWQVWRFWECRVRLDALRCAGIIEKRLGK